MDPVFSRPSDPWTINLRRGEVTVELGGRRRILRLTLGALAELESTFQAESLLGLAERFDAGKFRASDCLAIVSAALRGAGESVGEAELASIHLTGGAASWIRLVNAILAVTFGTAALPEDAQAGTNGNAGSESQ